MSLVARVASARNKTWSTPSKWVLVLGAVAVYLLAFGGLASVFGSLACIFVTVPVSAAAWSFRLRGGFAAGILTYPLNLAVLGLYMPDQVPIWALQTGIVYSVAETLVGSIIGKTRDLQDKLREEVQNRSKSAESQRRSAMQEETLADIGRIIHSAPDIEQVFDLLAFKVKQLIPFDFLSISRTDLDAGTTRRLYVTGTVVPKRRPGEVAPLAETLSREVTRTGSTISLDAESESELASRFPGLVASFQMGLSSFLAVPLISSDHVIGVMHFRSCQLHRYNQSHRALAQNVASQISGAIANAQLYRERLRAERSLSESEERYRSLVETSPDAIVVTKMGEIIYVNPAGVELLGAAGDQDLIGKSYIDFVHPDFKALAAERISVATEEMEPIPQRYSKVVGLDGRVRDVEVTGTPLFQDRERTVQITLREITGRLQAEQALLESEARSTALLEYASEGIVVANQAGEIVLANARTEEMFGYTRTELLGNLVEILIPENLRTVHGHHRASYNQNPSNRTMGQDLQLSGQRKDGSFFPVDVSLSNVKTHDGMLTLAFITDVTKSRHAEEALRESEAKYKSLLVQSPDCVFVSRVDDFKFTEVNDQACSAYGYTQEEFLNMRIFDIEVAPALENNVRDLYDSTPPGQVVEVYGENRRKDGTTFPVHVRFTKLNDEFAIANVRDITEVREAEEKQSRLANENSVMAELGRIISSSSDFSEVCDMLGVEIEKLIPFDRIALTMDGATDDSLSPIWVTGTEVPGRQPGDPVPLAGTSAEHTIRNRATTILEASTERHLWDTFPGLLPNWQVGLRSFMGAPLIYRDDVIGVLQVHSKQLGVYSTREAALLERVATQISGALANSVLFKQHQETEAALIESEAEHRALLEHSPDIILRFDKEMRHIYVNPAIEELTGLPPSAFIGKTHLELGMPENVVKNWQSCLAKAMETGKSETINFEFPNDSGVRHYESNVVPEFDAEGAVQSVLVVARDVTARWEAEEQIKASLAEKELLLREINHRVKNNLQIVSSLLYLQSRDVQDPQARMVFEASQDRIKAMALVHEKLYQSPDLARIDFGDYIHSLTTELYSSYGLGASGIGLVVDVDGVNLGIDAAIPCGLIVNELVSNSLKHAFPGRALGEINIKLQTRGEQLTMVVKDNGIGFPPGLDISQVDSLGLTIVKALATQLGGQVALFSNDGAKIEINFPANQARRGI